MKFEDARKFKKVTPEDKQASMEDTMQESIAEMQARGLTDEQINEVLQQLEEDAVNNIVDDLRNKGHSDEEIFEALEAEYLNLKHNCPMEETAGYAIVQAAIEGKPVDVYKIFDAAIKDRLSETIEQYKIQIAQSLFPTNEDADLEEGQAFNDAVTPGPEVRPGAVQYQAQPDGDNDVLRHNDGQPGPVHLPQSKWEQPDGGGNDDVMMHNNGNPGPVHLPQSKWEQPVPGVNQYQPKGGPEHLPQSKWEQPHPGPFNLQPRIPGPQRLPQSRNETPHQNQFNSPGPVSAPTRRDVAP